MAELLRVMEIKAGTWQQWRDQEHDRRTMGKDKAAEIGLCGWGLNSGC